MLFVVLYSQLFVMNQQNEIKVAPLIPVCELRLIDRRDIENPPRVNISLIPRHFFVGTSVRSLFSLASFFVRFFARSFVCFALLSVRSFVN